MGRHSCESWYPHDRNRFHPAGTTLMQFTIDDTGSVVDPVIAQSSGNSQTDALAMACVRTWHYKPATQNGVPVAVPWRAKVTWDPNPSQAPSSCAAYYRGPPVDFTGKNGTSVLQLLIHHREVAKITLARSSGIDDLDRAAMTCVATWPPNIEQDGDFQATLSIDWRKLLSASTAR